jgi:hypothetical protein
MSQHTKASLGHRYVEQVQDSTQPFKMKKFLNVPLHRPRFQHQPQQQLGQRDSVTGRRGRPIRAACAESAALRLCSPRRLDGTRRSAAGAGGVRRMLGAIEEG